MSARTLFTLLARLAGCVLLADALAGILLVVGPEGASPLFLLVFVVPGLLLVLGAGVVARAFRWPEEPSDGPAPDLPRVAEWMRVVERAVGLYVVVATIPWIVREGPTHSWRSVLTLALYLGIAVVLLVRSRPPASTTA
jgi:hypothetical protein